MHEEVDKSRTIPRFARDITRDGLMKEAATCTVASVNWVDLRYSKCCSAAILLRLVCSCACLVLGAMLASCSQTCRCFCISSLRKSQDVKELCG